MRLGILVIGVVLLVVGAVLLFVPLSPQGTQKISSNATEPVDVLSVSGFSLTGNIPVSVSWTATGAVTVVAAACSASCATGSLSSLADLTIQNGTSGSFTLNQPTGGEIAVGVLSPAAGSNSTSAQEVTFTLTTALSTVGSALLIVGILLIIVGAVLKSRKPSPAPVSVPAPTPSATAPAAEPAAGTSP